MQISVNELIKTLPYTLSYFFKLLKKAGVKNRIVLDDDDLVNLKNYFKENEKYSYKSHIALNKLNEVKENER